MVYVEVGAGDVRQRLINMCTRIQTCFRDKGWLLEGKPFEPHMTILKLSKCTLDSGNYDVAQAEVLFSTGRNGPLKRFPEGLYSKFSDHPFGIDVSPSRYVLNSLRQCTHRVLGFQSVHQIDLCAMKVKSMPCSLFVM